MRLPYTPNPPPVSSDPEEASIVQRIQARRHPRPLQPLDLTLLHSPAVADGWNSFLGAIRTRTTSIPADLREIAISRVAVVNRAWYEWMHHAPLAVAAGVGERGMETVKRDGALDVEEEGFGGLSEKQWVVLCYADEMTRNVEVNDKTFQRLRGVMESEKEVVEITAIVAAYNCVSRFLVALDVGEKNGVGPDAAH
ncbi:AhpD-like protein [Echria macrotheca]|uniref:AhpD-like protein n=1 Tax=Echria macrotheca TaxID=438768 RepID=A0AAJ0B4D7_9PEZI|nr:AhpD-like protein [Echria macrotheca]